MKRIGTSTGCAALLVIVLALCGPPPAGATAPGTNGRMAYSRFEGRHADIVSANPDGTDVVRLTSGPAETYDYNPDWSSDGSKIAFERDRSGCGCVENAGPSEIFTMNADGTDVRQITFDEFPGAGDPAWSPDGTRIAVQRFDIPAGRDGIYIMNADGSHPVQVTQNDARLGENVEPQWSPDGTKLVFQIVSDTKGSAIFTVNLDGTGERRLTPYGLFAEHPDWSPDGRLIIFESYGDGAPPGVSTNVFTVRPDGSHLTNVTNDEGGAVNAANPAWSPDGTKIVFVQLPGSGPFGYADIFTMNADGSDIRQVTTSSFWDFRPDWGSHA
jgi:Tol biopolymer transport system component